MSIDQPRWPRGTPIAPSGHGPGGGRWRGDGVDLTHLLGGEFDSVDPGLIRQLAGLAGQAGFTSIRHDPSVGVGGAAVNPANPDELLVASPAHVDPQQLHRTSNGAHNPFAEGGTFWMPESRERPLEYLIEHEAGHRFAMHAGVHTGRHSDEYARFKQYLVDYAAQHGIQVVPVAEDFSVQPYTVRPVEGAPGRALNLDDISGGFPQFSSVSALSRMGMSYKGSYQGPAEAYAELYAAYRLGSQDPLVLGAARSEGWTRPDWADQVESRLPRVTHASAAPDLPSLVPPGANQYVDTPAPELDHWARGAFDYEGPGGTRSQVRSTRAFHFNGGTWITVAGDFIGPAERSDGRWSVELRYPPSGSGYRPFATIHGVDVRSEARGQGIARAWLQRLENELRVAGVERIEMLDVSHAGRGASYWQQFGYHYDGESGVTIKYL